MKKINDGGRAFPWCGDLNDCPTINLGMALRDYFAAKAMNALIAGSMADGSHFDKDSPRLFATASYAMADAMIAAREQTEE